ncbi:transposase [Microcystis phage Mwe-Yong1]|nr:transposase [Microcystis phage Mwe-Yong1]
MPATARGWGKIAEAEGWRAVAGKARREGKGWVYHLTLFPASTQVRLLLAERAAAATDAPERAPLWERFDALPDHHKQACRDRLAAVTACHRLLDTGMTLVAAVALAASDAGVSCSTLRNWLALVRSHNRADWLAALAPDYRPTAQFAPCHPAAWAALKSDYLRPSAPGFSACYRRMVAAAAREGWSPIPSEMALRRRLAAEVPAAVATLARQGADKAKAIYPAQRRSRAQLRAMSVVNIDGHRFDVFVRKGDGQPFRPMLVAIQDVYSGKFLAWRLDESESRVPVRLAIGDMVERYGIPEHMVLDNGRSFASKWITGGTANRFRFKVRDDEPDGLLTQLGVQIHWALPFHGQAKPIERAFRDFCEDIARHPFCAGAYTGNSPLAKPEDYGRRAVEWQAFRQFVDAMIVEHNARPGRRSESAQGRSFDDTFAASLALPDTIVRWPTAEQRDLWLLMAEEITTKRGNGEIQLLGNRYWSPALVEWAGRKVHVRFDPDDLTRDVKVYDRKGRFLLTAELYGDADFLDAGAAQAHGRRLAEFQKTQRKLRDLHVTMKPEELGALYAPPAAPEAPVERPAVTRLATRGNAALKPAPQSDWTPDHEDGFGAVVDLLAKRTARGGG